MSSAGFDPANWSHWLLVICFVALSAWGLALSWQWGAADRKRRKWNKRMRAERRRIELARQLAVESGATSHRLPQGLQMLAARSTSRK